MSSIFSINSASFQDFEHSGSFRSGPNTTIDFTQAIISMGSFSGTGANLTNVSASYIIPTANTTASMAITSSFSTTALNSTTASFALNSPATTLFTSSTYQITASSAKSASWSPNQGATTLFTASTFPITSSWTVSSSWSPNQGATTIITGSTYQITASSAVSSSWSPNQGATTLFTGSTFPITSSGAVTSSFALTSPATTLFTASVYQITSSWATNSISSSYFSGSLIRIGDGLDQSILHISASDQSDIPLLEIDSLYVNSVFQIDSTGSMIATGSLQGTSSYALTSSYLNSYITRIISGSDFTRTRNTNLASINPLSFSMNPGENWICDFYGSVVCSNARGIRFSISSSAGAGFTTGNIEGWAFVGGGNSISFGSSRIMSMNTILSSSASPVANIPVPYQIHFSIMNPRSTSTIAIAAGVSNALDTATILDGAYMVAQKIR